MQYFLETVDTIEPGRGFTHFSGSHLLWIGIMVAFVVALSVTYRRKDTKTREKWRKGIAIAILLDELWKMFWLTVGGNYTLDYLPLHLCSVNIILIAIHAWRPGGTLGNYLYTVCVPAALAALLFPSWTPLPVLNFMYLHSFTVHILLAAYPIVLTVGGDIRPDWRKLPASLLLALCMAVPIYGFNLAFDTNFMFLMYAEAGNPLLLFEDLMGHHLWGVPVLGGAAVALMYGAYYGFRRLKKVEK